jgi:hypothetical protein
MAKDKNAKTETKEQAEKTAGEGKAAVSAKEAPEKTPEERQAIKAITFGRVLPPRMNKALKAIKLVGQCSGTNYYYTETQAAKIVEALQVAVRQVADSYQKGVKKAPSFTLP